jgi:flavin reductase (DIM6/NTAB) family NADH-FMN oxidoreductase RutF
MVYFGNAGYRGQFQLSVDPRFLSADNAGSIDSMDNNLARAMAGLTTGIYVLTTQENGQCHGMSSSWVAQVSGEPVMFTTAVDNAHFSRAVVERTGAFGLNIVGRRGRELEDYFYSSRARRDNNLDAIEFELSPTLAVPWLKLAMIALEARVVDSRVAGDHAIFIASPVGVRIGANDRPLTSLDLDYVYLGGRQVVARDRSGWD